VIDVGLDKLSKSFGPVVAVDDVSLAIRGGELFFVLGPSGCGKTTLLRCVAGFYEPDGGRILFGQRDVTDLPAHRRDAAMVFQNYALWPHMTVAQNVAFGLQCRGVDRRQRRQRVGEELSRVQMADLAGRKPNALSGGQQQRVALARALVVEPQCLLLDEPLSNLDAKLRLEMRSEIRRICKEANLTGIYVTHDQAEALSMADRIAVLRDGRLEQVGPPRELYERPANRFVAGFLGETNFVEGHVSGARGPQVLIRTAIGELCSATFDQTVEQGDKVVCSIRPESVRLGRAAAEAGNRFEGTVTGTMYLGQMARHQLRVDQTNLTVFELDPGVGAAAVGGRVEAWVDPVNVVVLR